ncbi:MAG TPA: hypothetical protein VFI25_14820 [Planctomycetota bacterium]|jgi:hypothetical protein|nr:hypothetical protein [Planctomycetota bacterium]
MALTTFLSLLVMGCALVVVFRYPYDRGAQYLGVLALALGAAAVAVERRWLPFPAAWHPRFTLPAAAVVVGLLLFIRLQERSFALLLLFGASLQALVGANLVNELRG